MTASTKIFPSIHFNQMAEPVEFVESWRVYYPYLEPDYGRYLELLDNESFTEQEMLWLFEFLLNEKLTGEKYDRFMEQVGSRVRVLNVLIENEDVGDLYTDDFLGIEPRWYVLLHHILYKFPFFDDNICEAYKFITKGESSDIATEDPEDDFIALYNDYSLFMWDIIKQTPEHGENSWSNAMWAFGKFLKDFGWVMFSAIHLQP